MKYKVLDQSVNYPNHKHNNGRCIYGMHYPEVKAGGPVGVFFPEKIHYSNILKCAQYKSTQVGLFYVALQRKILTLL
ncbi:hypothetical protein KXQ82_11260 [Mucilaginibacter sp. HMF5004]|nr:hypothetical protein [Mucilaginibacter rivuli]MBW4890301.1 hypothetical protein [Mucilaginibacter rivuli]